MDTATEEIVDALKRDIGCLHNLLQIIKDNCPQLEDMPEFIEAQRAEALARKALANQKES